jgi:hypothetical protein
MTASAYGTLERMCRRPSRSLISAATALGTLVASVGISTIVAEPLAQAAVTPVVTPSTSSAFAPDAPDPDIVLSGGVFYGFTTGTVWGNQIGIITTANANPSVGWHTVSGKASGSTAFNVSPPAPWERVNTQTSPGVYQFNGTWIMFYDAIDAANGHYCISVATSSVITGPYTDSSSGPLVCQLASGGSIDPQPFVDPSTGFSYLVWKTNDGSSSTASSVWSEPIGAGGVSLIGTPTPIFTVDPTTYAWQTTADDPDMVFAGGTYYLFFSGGNYLSNYYPTGYVVCSGPSGPCDSNEPADPILNTNGGSGGGMVFTDASGAWWISYQTWESPSCTNYSCGGARDLYIAPISLPNASAGPPPPTPDLPVQRIAGQDAIGTALAVSQAEFPTSGSARGVVLARSDFFSDALAGGPLAASIGGPLLITPGASESGSLDPRVEAEIQRVLPSGGTVYVLGGDLALSVNIDIQLAFLGYKVVREAGADEYATAVDIAGALGDPSTVFEATGLSFQDALSAVPAAIARRGAILLTDGNLQAPETAAYLAAHPFDTRYAIGGSFAAAGADPSATAIFGQDLYDTSAAVASAFFARASVFGAATGLNFPDALAGGVFMGTRGGPVLLVEPSLPLPSNVDSYLLGDAQLSNGFLFGGSLAVGDDVAAAL